MKSFWEEVEEGIWQDEPEQQVQQEQSMEEEDDFSMGNLGMQIANEDFEDINYDPEYLQNYQPASEYSENSSYSGNFTSDIVQKESGGNYKAVNPNSSAAGKYQFLWNTWGNEIKSFTGVSSKQDFLNNPQAQDSFYNDYYLPNKLMPAVKRLKQISNLSEDQLAKLVHFRGEAGAAAYIQGKVPDKPETYNSSISDYIDLQYGGQTQYDSLGNPVSVRPGMENQYSSTKYGLKPIEYNQQESNIENEQNDSGELYDFGIVEDLYNVYDKGKKFVQEQLAGVAGKVSSGIDVANGMLANKQNLENYNKRMKLLQDDRYFPVNQLINNIPIYS